MSTSIDEKVVEMKFDNNQFQSGVRSTMSALDALKQKLNFKGASKGLEEIGSAADANRGALGSLAQGVQSLTNKFSAMSIVAITALTNIVNKAVNAGINITKALTIDPIKTGLAEYETNLNSIQTILANTQASGATLKDVNRSLNELNTYSDKTIYNFSEMARNIGTFTAAGVDLDRATASIKGIANLAALSGSNSQQASTAMYQLSQAIASGRVSLMDWNSVVNAGMGGTTFQRALAQTAVKMGTLDKGALKLSGKMKNVTIAGKSFRDSISGENGKSWLTSDVLTKTLTQFTGDLTDAQLKAQGFTAAEIKSIQATAKTAEEAATQVKTLSGVFDTAKETAGSGWAQTWQIVMGDFGEAKKTFTGISNALNNFINASSNARNKVLGDWKALGGRQVLIDGLKNAFQALSAIVTPIKTAFRDIFPATTGKQLFELTKTFLNFTKNLKIGSDTAFKIRRIFQGLFSVLDIGWTVIKGVVKVIKDLFGQATEGAGGFLDFAARVGDWLTALRYSIKYGDGLNKVLSGLKTVLSTVIGAVKKFAGFIKGLFSDGDSSALEAAGDRIAKRFEPLGALGDFIAKAWEKITQVFQNAWNAFSPLAQKMADWFRNLGTSISDALGGINFNTVLDAINTGLFAGLVLSFKKFLGGFGKESDAGEGIFAKIKGALDGVTGTLKTMQTTLKASTLLMIAAALLMLTASIVALSMIDSAALTKALIAITVMFAQLMGAMVIMEKYVKSGGMVKAGIALILLATAIRILASAVKTLAQLDWQGIAKGLVGVGGLLIGLALFTKFADTNKGGFKTGAGLLLLAIGIKILASAVGDFAKMDWGSIGKGLAAISAILLAFAGFTRIVGDGKRIVQIGIALGIIAVSMKILASALSDFAAISWEQMGRGMVAMAGALGLITAAMRLLPKGIFIQATALVVIAGALKILSGVIQSMGGMSWEEIGKGLATLAGGLLIIAGAMKLMADALPGAAALAIVAGSLLLLLPVLTTFANMSWEQIVKGLLMLAGVFTVLGLAGLVLEPVIPALLALGVAVALLGVGMLAAGAGLLAFSIGLTALAAAGAAGTAAIVAIVSGLIGLIPTLMTQIALGVVAFAKTIAAAAPAIMGAMVVVMNSMLQAIRIITPNIVNTLLGLIVKLVQALSRAIPQMVRAGLQLIIGILTGIRDNIGKIVTIAGQIIVNFLNAISGQLPKIIQSGVNLIVSFVEGLARAIRSNSARMNAAGLDLARAIVEGMANGIRNGIGIVVDAARSIASGALNTVKNFLGIHSPSREFYKLGQYVTQGFSNGIHGNQSQVASAFDGLKKMLQDTMRSSKADVDALQKKLYTLTHARRRDTQAIAATKKALAEARSEYNKSSQAYSTLTKYWTDDRNKLVALGNQYDAYTEKIKAANSALEDAKKTRDDYNKSVTDQYSDLPDISKDTKLSDYVSELQKKIVDTQMFSIAIQKLRDLGLNDSVYKELIAKGPEAMPFVQELLAGGKTSVDEINTLGTAMSKAASQMGSSASSALYQAAVDSAAGLVKGLQNQQGAIEIQMDKIADAMVAAIKKKLGIKSPSREFMAVGEFTGEGLVLGLKAYNGIVADSAKSLGHEAIDALRKTVTGLSEIVSGEVDLNPVVKPSLDLTDVQKDAARLGSIISTMPVSMRSSYASARAAAWGLQKNQDRQNGSDSASVDNPAVVFNQNNYSPKALSSAEIYRQTKNQLSVAKGALTK